jgi:hypothetical protein
LTSLTLVIATVTNLVFLPVLLLSVVGRRGGPRSDVHETVLDSKHNKADASADL